jgi:hypothetical protein
VGYLLLLPALRGRQLEELEALPPLRPAAFFWAVLPPLPRPLLFLLWLLPLLLPPLLDEPGEFEIAAARDLLMPCLRRPSYCLSFLTLGPWSFAIVLTSVQVIGRMRSRCFH